MVVLKTFGTNIAEQSSTIGTGTYELGGNLVGYRRFSDDFVTGDTPYYAVKNASETKFEFNKAAIFTDATPDTLARGVWLSSNSNAAVSWGSDDLPLIIYVPTSGEVLEAMVTGWLSSVRNTLLKFGLWWKLDTPTAGKNRLYVYDGASDISILDVDTAAHTAALNSLALGTPPSGNLSNCTNYPNKNLDDFIVYLGSNVAIGAASNVNLFNTGSFGHNGEKWEIMANVLIGAAGAATTAGLDLHNGTTTIAGSESVAASASWDINVPACAIITLTGAITITARGSGNQAGCTAYTTGFGYHSDPNHASWIKCRRIS